MINLECKFIFAMFPISHHLWREENGNEEVLLTEHSSLPSSQQDLRQGWDETSTRPPLAVCLPSPACLIMLVCLHHFLTNHLPNQVTFTRTQKKVFGWHKETSMFVFTRYFTNFLRCVSFFFF